MKQLRAWAWILAALLCGAVWADDDTDKKTVVIVQKDETVAPEDAREAAREIRDVVREAARGAREVAREVRQEAERGQTDEFSGLTTEDRDEIRETLREVFRGSGDAIREAGEAMHELFAQALPMIAPHALGPQFALGDSGAGKSRPVDEKKSAAGVDEIGIHNIAGQIVIVGSDADEIHVEGTLGEDVEELIFTVEGTLAEIRVKVPEGLRNRKIRSDLTIHLPKRLRVEAKTVSGGIEARDVQGSLIELKAVSGGIRVKACTGDIEANTVSGGIEIADAQKSVDAECVSGGITVRGTPTTVAAQSVSGGVTIEGVQQEVRANSVSGRVDVIAGKLSRFTAESVSGGIGYEGALAPGARVKLNTLSGGVRLLFTEDVSAEFDLHSFSGGIEVDLPGAPKTGKRKLTFKTGTGDARIDVEAFSGGVRVGKK